VCTTLDIYDCITEFTMYHDMLFFSMYHFVIVYYHNLASLFVLLNLNKVAVVLSYGSLIYKYLCHQCISSLKL
jgi:hypothetical protein